MNNNNDANSMRKTAKRFSSCLFAWLDPVLNPYDYGDKNARKGSYLRLYGKSHYRSMVIVVLLWVVACLVLKFVILNFPEMSVRVCSIAFR